MTRTAYVNGEYLPLEQASVSVLDRGFLFADGIYEVAAVLGGRLVDNAGHVARLERSLSEIGIKNPYSLEEWVRIETELVARDGLEEGLVYLQVTRGAAERDFSFPKDTAPTVVAFTQAKKIAHNPLAESGAKVVTVPDIRWQRRDIKSVALLAQVLAKQAASEAGAAEAFMVEDGSITEGSSSTAFIVTRDGTIVTRPLSNALLPGITRRAVIALATEFDLKLEERLFSVEELHDAAEAFYTSASAFVMPVVSVDGRALGDGRPGPVARRLRELYFAFAEARD
ncbi:D-amino-acid transaminase [Methylobacterium sp. C25]|uniref:D-amino-acid transaminase n=1 Tax=Methylobacterium sp. C25 TaxID=2721622 RepID=UPI001F44D150|nr:D-amino-acid transaminase [Methylobacterium sp. C25]MCE4226742.1 D-amino-acid transaminase [Methylobacterium sp. C25]